MSLKLMAIWRKKRNITAPMIITIRIRIPKHYIAAVIKYNGLISINGKFTFLTEIRTILQYLRVTFHQNRR